jgi:hypothetical protein
MLKVNIELRKVRKYAVLGLIISFVATIFGSIVRITSQAENGKFMLWTAGVFAVLSISVFFLSFLKEK